LLVDELGTFPLNDLCLALRAVHPFVPILVLFRSDSYGDRVKLLRAGADDVLSAPYALEELLARVEALLRRSAFNLHASDSDSAVLRHRDLSVHTDQRTVQRGGKPIKLTVKEYDLLLHLLKHHGVVQPRLDILKAVWGHTWVGNDNLLDVYIRYLRKKIERPDLDPLIHTVRGVGFMLD
jgi:two-component system response regulator MprA